MITIVTSMEREVKGIRQGIRAWHPQYRPANIFVSGVNNPWAENSLGRFLDGPERPDAVVAMGFAGALRDELLPGDLVISRRLYCSSEGTFLEADQRLLELVQEALEDPSMPRQFVADGVTVPSMVDSQASKRQLAGTTTAWVANMEDYWICRVAAQKEIPFVSVRAVLDTVNQKLPPFIASIGNKRMPIQLMNVMSNLALRPWDLPKLATLAKQAKAAQISLTTSGLAILTTLGNSHIGDNCNGNNFAHSLSLPVKMEVDWWSMALAERTHQEVN